MSDRRRELKTLVHNTVDDAIKVFKDNGWLNGAAPFKPEINCRFGGKSSRSYGGAKRSKRDGTLRPYLSFALAQYAQDPNASLREYKSFERSQRIGSVLNNSEFAVRAIVLHEMAHALLIMSRSHYHVNRAKVYASAGIADTARSERGHGSMWKFVYGLLRDELLNDELGEDNFDQTPKRERVVGHRQRNVLGRKYLQEMISGWKLNGLSNAECIANLTGMGIKLNTARTYTYTTKKGVDFL